MLRQFGGLTFFPRSNQGFWTVAGVTYQDAIVIYRIITADVRTARRFLRELKQELKHDLDQEEILIVEKEADLL